MPHREPVPVAAKLLAPQHMADGYLALTVKAKEQLGPQAWIECEKNLYWVHVRDDVDRVCLGLVYAQADCTLDAVIAIWHREWRDICRARDLEEQHYTELEWEYLVWWNAANEKPEAGVSLPPASGAATAHPSPG